MMQFNLTVHSISKIMEHECEVKHFQFKFLPKIIVGKQTDVERGQLISSTKFGHIIVSQSNGEFLLFILNQLINLQLETAIKA